MPQLKRRTTPARMRSDDWSDKENAAVVAAHFAMLGDELFCRSYGKAEQNR